MIGASCRDVLPPARLPERSTPSRRPAMSEPLDPVCNEGDAPEPLDRREFVRLLGGSAAAVTVLGTAPRLFAEGKTEKPVEKTEKKDSPAETLVKELFAGMNDEQKKQ